jgi:hypothetical protein
MEPFSIHCYCYENADITAISRPSKYSLEFAIKACNSTDKITDASDRFCPIHGNECIGHMERYKDMLFLPIWMTPSSRTEENALVTLKHQCIHGLVSYDKYVREVLALLHGKTGYVRSVSRMTVMGSIRMGI